MINRPLAITIALLISITAAHGSDCSYTLKPTIDGTKHKKPFVLRHPKWHRFGKKIRKACIILLPVTGVAANIVTAVRL